MSLAPPVCVSTVVIVITLNIIYTNAAVVPGVYKSFLVAGKSAIENPDASGRATSARTNTGLLQNGSFLFFFFGKLCKIKVGWPKQIIIGRLVASQAVSL